MTRAPWTTVEQREWLNGRLPGWANAQDNGTSKAYRAKVFEDWYKAFPLSPPMDKELAEAGGNASQALRAQREVTDNRLYQWFYNHSRTLSSQRDTINLQKQTRLPAIWQIYQRLHYREKLKVIVDATYEEHLRSKEGEVLDSASLKRERLRIQNKVAREKYETESDDVKAEVEKYREELRNGERKDPEQLQKNIGILPNTLNACIKTLHKETGWMFLVLAGGPTPRQNGTISTMTFCSDSPEDGVNFEEDLGSADWQELVDRWGSFLHRAYPEDARANLALSTSPEPSESNADKNPSTLHNDTQTKKNKKPAVESEYERARRENIARNKEMLAEVFEREALQFPPKRSKKGRGKGKGRKTPTSPEQVNSDSEPLETETGGSNTMSALPAPTVSPTARSTSPSSSASTAQETASVGATNSSPSKPPPSDSPALVNEADIPSPRVTVTSHESSTLITGATSHNVPPSHVTSTPSPRLSVQSVDVNLNNSVANHIPLPADQQTSINGATASPLSSDISVAGSESHDDDAPADSVGNATSDIGNTGLGNTGRGNTTAVLPTPLPIDNREPTRDCGSVTTCKVHDATTDGHGPKALCVPPEILKNAPAFVREGESYFRTVGASSTVWGNLVVNWVRLELSCKIQGNLSTQNRPPVVGGWQKRARKFSNIPTIKVGEFVGAFREWWKALQPPNRDMSSGWPPPRDLSDDTDWSSLSHTGRNGVFLVMMSLSWWAHHATSPALVAEFDNVVEDVNWAFTTIVKFTSTNPAKRSQDDEAGVQPRKRAAHS